MEIATWLQAKEEEYEKLKEGSVLKWMIVGYSVNLFIMIKILILFKQR
jgi:hypothetical protein